MKRWAIAKMSAGAGRSVAVDVPGCSTRRRQPRDAARPSLDSGELTARMIIVALFTFMAVRLGADFLQTGRITGLLLLASEALVVVLTVFRRSTGVVDRSVRARVLMTLSLIGPLLVAPTAGLGSWPRP